MHLLRNKRWWYN